MREDAINIEEDRVGDVGSIKDYPSYHERHRVFPEIFENRNHKNIIDIAAGVGIVGKRIKEGYPGDILCNDISSTCLRLMKNEGLSTVSFDIDNHELEFPFADETFDALIALATIEHLIHIDHFVEEIYRIIKKEGYFYVSAPNYSGLLYLIPFLFSGKTFHDPMSGSSKYEFYAHVRYFTYKTLLEFVSSFGFTADTVYLPLPQASSRYQALKEKSPLKAFVFRSTMKIIFKSFSPRFASEPVICFRKAKRPDKKIRKVIL